MGATQLPLQALEKELEEARIASCGGYWQCDDDDDDDVVVVVGCCCCRLKLIQMSTQHLESAAYLNLPRQNAHLLNQELKNCRSELQSLRLGVSCVGDSNILEVVKQHVIDFFIDSVFRRLFYKESV